MCGICGVVGSGLDIQANIERMLPKMAHRGPDNTGSWISSNKEAGLGHTRLSIVDLSPAGHQPMANEDGRIRLTANGEIYNSPPLRQWLWDKGHAFRSASDNEVLIHGYEEKGTDFLPLINGMIAFGLWDGPNEQLLLCRDRLGIKPLYYVLLPGGGLAFASEIKALLACPEIPAAIDSVGLKQYLTFENTFGARTLHNGVKMLEPGQYLLWKDGNAALHSYWAPSFEASDTLPDFPQACEAYRETVHKSVARHMMSDVEVASYLSSGFDSTTVAHFAAQTTDTPLATYTGAFGQGGWYDETPGARAVAEHIGSAHTEVRMGATDFASALDDLVYFMDEPRMGIGAFSQYMVAKQAAERVKVILTGHAGDELFAGYPVFKLLLLRRTLGRNPLKGLGLLLRVRPAEWPHVVYFLLQQLLGRSGRFLPTLFSSSMLRKGLKPDVAAALKDIRPEEELATLVGDDPDPYRCLTRTYLRAYLPGLFVVEDKISMAHSLESRTPLCDNELVELALTWPLSLKLNKGVLKAIPKAAMRSVLPDILYEQPKRGFPTPLGSWLRGELNDLFHERLLGQGSPLHDLFERDFLEKSVAKYESGWQKRVTPLDQIPTHRMWQLLCLDAWLRNSTERLGRSLSLA